MKKFLVALCILVSGCTSLHRQPRPEPLPSFRELATEHKYISALKALNTQRPMLIDYEQQRDTILSQARDYQAGLLNTANEYARQQQYVQALAVLEGAQDELPASRDMSQTIEQLMTARDRYTQRYLDELIPLKATQLQRDHATYLALQKSASTPELQGAVARHFADVDYFAPLIAKAGTQALAQNDFSRAQQFLSIANQLTPTPEIARQLARSQQVLTNNRKKQQVAQIVEREQRYRELSNDMLQSLQQRDFVAAREQLAQARELNIHTEEMDSAQRLLDNIISNYVVQQVEAGNQLYADGKIEDALRSWRQAEALSPTPDIKEKIEKAQKFIDRLQQLQKQPGK